MSLGWIKVTVGLCDKPEVMQLARTLDIDRDKAAGLLVKFWSWADGITVDGVVDGVVARDVDDMMTQPGFARTLEVVGWLKIDDEKRRLAIPNFERHNGESAKKRALRSERQARWRRRTVDVPVDAHVDAAPSTREEKRREDIKERAGRSQGSRLPSDWQPPEELKTWAFKERPDLDIEKTIENFRDYWIAKAGKDATKVNWSATFRNWVRKERKGNGEAHPPEAVSSKRCRYCPAPAIGNVNGIDHCRAHSDEAYDRKAA